MLPNPRQRKVSYISSSLHNATKLALIAAGDISVLSKSRILMEESFTLKKYIFQTFQNIMTYEK